MTAIFVYSPLSSVCRLYLIITLQPLACGNQHPHHRHLHPSAYIHTYPSHDRSPPAYQPTNQPIILSFVIHDHRDAVLHCSITKRPFSSFLFPTKRSAQPNPTLYTINSTPTHHATCYRTHHTYPSSSIQTIIHATYLLSFLPSSHLTAVSDIEISNVFCRGDVLAFTFYFYSYLFFCHVSLACVYAYLNLINL